MKHQPSLLTAGAITMPASLELSSKEREALAEELGYRKIGAELPDGVSLSNIIQSLPSEVAPAILLLQWSSMAADMNEDLSEYRVESLRMF